jgi:hypothetical protein
MGKTLIIIGIFLIIGGLFLIFKIQIPFIGKLPGDITITGEKYQVYFPIVSCILISIIISLIFYLFSHK